MRYLATSTAATIHKGGLKAPLHILHLEDDAGDAALTAGKLGDAGAGTARPLTRDDTGRLALLAAQVNAPPDA